MSARQDKPLNFSIFKLECKAPTLKKFFIVILFILLAGGGYYGYQYWLDNRDINTWSLVPEDAYFVYEVEDAVGVWQTLDSTKTGFTLKSLPAFQKANSYLIKLDSISGSSDKLLAFFRANPLLISGHATAKDKIDILVKSKL